MASKCFSTTDENRKISDFAFHYYECNACGLIFLGNIPDKLQKYYPDNYYYIPSDINELGSIAKPESYKLDILKSFCQNGHLLEIGPSSGAFSYLAQQAGFDVTTIEMNKACCDFLNRSAGIKSFHCDNEIEKLSELSQFDVIVLWHVIEHLNNPWQMIEAAHEHLISEGILILAAPNPDAVQFRLQGKHWVHIDAPRHIYLLPPEFITRLTRSMGMTTLMQTTTDKGSLGWNRFGWQQFFANRFTNSFARKIAYFVGKVVTFLLYPLESSEGKGSAYTIVLQKNKS
jgi:2-polyprenyl-3-methyl-5-hydroxy-6-metoxy-1,4-benzoquinol methylase